MLEQLLLVCNTLHDGQSLPIRYGYALFLLESGNSVGYLYQHRIEHGQEQVASVFDHHESSIAADQDHLSKYFVRPCRKCAVGFLHRRFQHLYGETTKEE